ncbi:MAG: hypothetical protein ACKO3Q_08340, partial [Betaproteobacteria bacterium]
CGAAPKWGCACTGAAQQAKTKIVAACKRPGVAARSRFPMQLARIENFIDRPQFKKRANSCVDVLKNQFSLQDLTKRSEKLIAHNETKQALIRQ